MMSSKEEESADTMNPLRDSFLGVWIQGLKQGQLLTIGIILGLGLVGYVLLVFFHSRAPKTKAAKIATPVTIIALRPDNVKSVVRGYGTVAARRELNIRPEVSGTVVSLAPNMEVGGRIMAGEIIFSLDKRDYEIALKDAEAVLERARFELKLEEGNQIIAKREWSLLQKDGLEGDEFSNELTLRKPHLIEKQAQLRAALAGLERARLNLLRTEFKAPFDSVVITEQLEVGRYVSPQEQVALLVAVDAFQIEAQIPKSDLTYLEGLMTGNNQGGVIAQIQQRTRDGMVFQRMGRAIRLLSSVSDAGRMARVLIVVEKPLDANGDGDGLPLLLGSYVEIIIEGREIQGVYAVPSRAIREGGVIWIVTPENTLGILPVQQGLSTPDTVYVSLSRESKTLIGAEPLEEEGIQVITNAISSPLDGMPVRIEQGDADVR